MLLPWRQSGGLIDFSMHFPLDGDGPLACGDVVVLMMKRVEFNIFITDISSDQITGRVIDIQPNFGTELENFAQLKTVNFSSANIFRVLRRGGVGQQGVENTYYV